ncbi:MAG: DUF72 domain-containing protein [Chloroflexi bacterium]|nr:DUF72 domain-containing protein [Chloroflexota bacterium]MBV9603170.1 DUF72 domain-containing protein [Chloroflexota bacterium]
MAHVWIGTSGWSYKHWENGKFYPQGTRASEFLPFFATHFATVEINYSYYQLPPRKTFELWRRKAPAGFVFAVKASRYLTHMKKLKDPAEPLERLLHNAGGLGKTLGPVLFQFPRQWKLNLQRLQEFCAALGAHPSHRYAFEFRHQSWLTAEVYAVLHDNNAALCLPIGWGIPLDVQVTADWTYIRFHGGERSHFFEDDELAPWAARIRGWREAGIDSYSYFNNDTLWRGRPAAIDNARRLREMVGD